jgi:septum formation protein
MDDSTTAGPGPVAFCLASASPSRRQVLAGAGLHPLARAADLDEGALVRAAEAEQGPLDLDGIVALLARAKAESVAPRLRAEGFRGLILGCDSNFGLDGISYGKPHTPERARERWRAMSGRSGVLASGHWLIDLRGERGPFPAAGEVERSQLRFARVDDAEIERYVASGEPLEVAGGFTLEGRASAFIERIEGTPSGVMGVSVPVLRRLAARLGVAWNRLVTPASSARTAPHTASAL